MEESDVLFNSLNYLVFFPAVVLLYFAIPAKYLKLRNVWLLISSYYFYLNWYASYALLLFGSTFITYVAGLLIDAARGKEKPVLAKWILGGGFAVNLGILFFYKYANFFVENCNRILGIAGRQERLGTFDILLPVGISFYIFQALGYTMDVYRGKTKATKNLFRYMLFVSFFPQLVAGPIERSDNLLKQFDEKHTFDADRAREGLLLMLWGLFMKIVIADNVAVYVNAVYGNYMSYTGVEIILATMLFAFQIYCDFGGYSYLAIGSAKVLGFRLMENFRAPYQAVSVKDFWARWHISLTGWFRDYLYIPLGGNRKGKARKYLNTLIVFFASGLWHGAAWTYIIWGVLNGVYMVLEDATKGLRGRIKEKLRVDESRFSYRLGCGLVTFLLIDFTWLFFRAESVGQAFAIIKQTVVSLQFPQIFGLAVNRMGFSMQQLTALIIAFLILAVVDVYKNRCGDVCRLVMKQGAWFRWLIYLGLLFMIMTYGAYGMDYTQTEFIYFQF